MTSLDRERLERLGLITLEERRNRANLVELFKISKGLSAISLKSFFELNSSGRTRGHSIKLKKTGYQTDSRIFFLSEGCESLERSRQGRSVGKDGGRFQGKASRTLRKEDRLFEGSLLIAQSAASFVPSSVRGTHPGDKQAFPACHSDLRRRN
jgi:hypothetical protein